MLQRQGTSGIARDQEFQGLSETRGFRACQRQGISDLTAETSSFRLNRDQKLQGLPETRGLRACRRPDMSKTRDFRACQRPGIPGLARNQKFQCFHETRDFSACQRPGISGLARNQKFQCLHETRDFRVCQRPGVRDCRGLVVVSRSRNDRGLKGPGFLRTC